MNTSTATAVVLGVWNGTRREDEAFYEALQVVRITPQDFRRLRGEVRRVSGSFPKLVILTPTAAGKRR